jgi:2-oxoacid:acceptor oxidoreductase gamma subunit (pyruvate/2-ketoisovalerate family)
MKGVSMKEIRIHGRGGQGAVVAGQILAEALVRDGKWASGFPSFGVERRGAPVSVFLRVDDRPIRERQQVYHPDCLLVMDSRLIHSKNIYDGIRSDCIVVLNTPEPITEKRHQNIGSAGVVDATKIGLEEVGIAVTNTCMMGAFARATGWVGVDAILSSLREYFSGKMLETNTRCVRRGFEETRVIRL